MRFYLHDVPRIVKFIKIEFHVMCILSQRMGSATNSRNALHWCLYNNATVHATELHMENA